MHRCRRRHRQKHYNKTHNEVNRRYEPNCALVDGEHVVVRVY